MRESIITDNFYAVFENTRNNRELYTLGKGRIMKGENCAPRTKQFSSSQGLIYRRFDLQCKKKGACECKKQKKITLRPFESWECVREKALVFLDWGTNIKGKAHEFGVSFSAEAAKHNMCFFTRLLSLFSRIHIFEP